MFVCCCLTDSLYILAYLFVFVNNFFKLFFADFLSANGEGGIRTHAPLRTNGFQDRLVMTTSIPLLIRFLSLTAYASASAARHIIALFLFNVNNFFNFFSKKFFIVILLVFIKYRKPYFKVFRSCYLYIGIFTFN